MYITFGVVFFMFAAHHLAWAAAIPLYYTVAPAASTAQSPSITPPRGPGAFSPSTGPASRAWTPNLPVPGDSSEYSDRSFGVDGNYNSGCKGCVGRMRQPVKDYTLLDSIDYRAEEAGETRKEDREMGGNEEGNGQALRPAKWYVYWRNGYLEIPRPREWHMPSPPLVENFEEELKDKNKRK